jgi:hypothetical protein
MLDLITRKPTRKTTHIPHTPALPLRVDERAGAHRRIDDRHAAGVYRRAATPAAAAHYAGWREYQGADLPVLLNGRPAPFQITVCSRSGCSGDAVVQPH